MSINLYYDTAKWMYYCQISFPSQNNITSHFSTYVNIASVPRDTSLHLFTIWHYGPFFCVCCRSLVPHFVQLVLTLKTLFKRSQPPFYRVAENLHDNALQSFRIKKVTIILFMYFYLPIVKMLIAKCGPFCLLLFLSAKQGHK